MIIARNNGATSDLHLQSNGGDVRLCSNAGNVGIGNVSPSFQLELSLNNAAKPTSSTWNVVSDAQLKKDIHLYTDGLDEILKINSVWFTYTGEAGMPQETGIGVIAQELEEIAPYMVTTWNYKDENENNKPYLSVNNGAMTYMLINAVKEQQQMLEDQSFTIQSQQAQIDYLMNELMDLKKLAGK